MEPLFDEIYAEFHYQLTGDIESYYKKVLLDTLIEQLKHSPKYMGVVKNACIVNSHLYVTLKDSVKTLPIDTRTRLINNVLTLLKTNNTIQWLSVEYTVN